MAELCPPRRTSKIITLLSTEPDAKICGRCGAHATDKTGPLCPGSPCVDSPDRKSTSRTERSDVPTATSSVDPGCEENECEYGVQSRLNVWTGVMQGGCNADNFNVPSCAVENIVEGTGSKGYIEREVIAWVCASGCEDLLTDAQDW